ncbi:MAG: Dyp-type peroxidase [Alishewanella sp.]|nr:Dyp-type peroxidase [Alishewanella sp.]
MAREQLGICAEANLHGSYLLINVLDGQEAMLRQKLTRLPQIINRLADHFSEAMLSGVVAISSHFWDSLYPWQRPAGLSAFPEFRSEHFQVSHSMADLFIQVRSDRTDVNYIALQQIYQLISPNVEIVENLSGFRYLDGRQLTGFIDAPTNPRGIKRRKAALVDALNDPVFAGGSYLYFYRLQLDQKHWLQLSTEQQEAIMGYQKLDGKKCAADAEIRSSHLTAQHVVLAPNDAMLLEQNMPYASLHTQGALQLCFSAESDVFSRLWRSKLGLQQSGIYDGLLDFCRIDLAAAFFVPSITFMEAAARGEFTARSSHLLE